MKRGSAKDIYIVLHNIRSAHNVGSIFRTADTASVSKIYLSGYTPAPKDRFGRENKEIAKTALGAEKFLSWESEPSIFVLLRKLKREKIFLVALEQSPQAIDYKKARVRRPAAFIFGNEVRGLSANVLQRCDAVAEIPMRGEKESLNVSVAVGVALFRMLKL